MTTSEPDAILRNAAWYLMRQQSIWNDRVPDGHGQMVPGPHHEAVMVLCRLASDVREERRRA